MELIETVVSILSIVIPYKFGWYHSVITFIMLKLSLRIAYKVMSETKK